MRHLTVTCDRYGVDLTGESRRHALEFVGGPERHREPIDLCGPCHTALWACLANQNPSDKARNATCQGVA